MNTVIKIFIISLAAFLLLPASAFYAEGFRLIHITSIYSDDKNIGIKEPEGAAFLNEKSQVIVADTGNGRLMIYLFKDDNQDQEVKEVKIPELPYPQVVKVDSRGTIYVIDGKKRKIGRLNQDGEFKDYVEIKDFSFPKSFCIDEKNNIYILDVMNRRVVVLDSENEFIKHIPFSDGPEIFSDIAIDSFGNIILIDGINAVLYTINKDSLKISALTESLKEFVRFPTTVTTDTRGRIYLLDRNGGRIIILGQDGTLLGKVSGMGWREGLLNYPAQLSLNKNGDIIVADTKNNRVQIFSLLE